MRILLVSPYFPPQNAVASLRTHGFARAWADAGHEVTVLTTAKRFDQRGLDRHVDGLEVTEIGFRVPGFLERMRAVEKSNEAAMIEPPSHKRSFAQRLKDRTGIFSTVRMPDLTDWWVRPAIAWARSRSAQRGPWDAVVSSSGPYTAHRVARILKADGMAKKWIADFRDLWVDNQPYRGLFPFTLIERRWERQCLLAADAITTVSQGLAESLQRKSRKDAEVICNGFDETELAALPAERVFPADGLVRLVFTGRLYSDHQDPSPLLEALAMLGRQDPARGARLRLMVAGDSDEPWRSMARRCGAERFLDFRGRISREDALRMQRDAAALVMIDWRDPRHGVLSTKLFEYMRSDAPLLIIGPCERSPIIDLAARAGRGVPVGVDPGNVSQVLTQLLENAHSLRGEPDRKFVATLSRRHQSMRMLDLMRSLMRE
jgi:glycosyltransferase involved in cell wall biosynthesis